MQTRKRFKGFSLCSRVFRKLSSMHKVHSLVFDVYCCCWHRHWIVLKWNFIIQWIRRYWQKTSKFYCSDHSFNIYLNLFAIFSSSLFLFASMDFPFHLYLCFHFHFHRFNIPKLHKGDKSIAFNVQCSALNLCFVSHRCETEKTMTWIIRSKK